MNKEEIIEMAQTCVSCDKDCMACNCDDNSICALTFAQYIIDKENEPAPSANDTSSKCNELQLNDNIKSAICQEMIKKFFSLKGRSASYKDGYFQAIEDIMDILDKL